MIFISELEPTKAVSIFVQEEHVLAFKELVYRATNLWPDAPPEIKRFADVLLEGKPLQNYEEQEYYKINPRPKYRWGHMCSCGYLSVFTTISPDKPNYPITCHNEELEVLTTDPEGKEVVTKIACKRTEKFKQVTISTADGKDASHV